MKSERRHELTTNELADWIVHFPQWLKENRSTVIIGTIIIVALIAYTIFYYGFENKTEQNQNVQITRLLNSLRAQKETTIAGKAQGLGVSDSFFTLASSLEEASAKTENPILSALAMIKRAEALRSELHYRSTPAEADVQKYQLNQAKGIYENALKKAGDNATVAAMAKYGIGLCLEDLGDFDGAQAVYQQIATEEKYADTTFAPQAQYRLQILPEIARPVHFTQAPAAEVKIQDAMPVDINSVQ